MNQKNKHPKRIADLYDAGERCLFVGNGLNRVVDKGRSWEELLKELGDAKLDISNKPFPLIFEEIAFKNSRNTHIEHTILKLKTRTAELLKILKPNKFHERIVGLNKYKHIVTTNYDYNIEKAISPNFEAKRKKSYKYSLYRRNSMEGIYVWHIHGELVQPESIMLGYEHYGDYINKVHPLIKGDRPGLLNKIKNTKPNWVHLFFTKDIDFIGYGFDFTETHLWYIINFRARLKQKGATICNTLTFYYPSIDLIRLKPKLDLLKSLDVTCYCIEVNTYHQFYEGFIKIKSEDPKR